MEIKAIRERLNLTQAQLAAELGLTQSSVSRFETGDLAIDARTRLAIEALEARAARGSESAVRDAAA